MARPYLSRYRKPGLPSRPRIAWDLHGIWSRRYQAIVVSSEEEVQVARLKYILGHGVNQELTERPRDWPSIHLARALVDGKSFQGYWFSRTQEYAARQRGEKLDRLQYATPERP